MVEACSRFSCNRKPCLRLSIIPADVSSNWSSLAENATSIFRFPYSAIGNFCELTPKALTSIATFAIASLFRTCRPHRHLWFSLQPKLSDIAQECVRHMLTRYPGQRAPHANVRHELG